MSGVIQQNLMSFLLLKLLNWLKTLHITNINANSIFNIFHMPHCISHCKINIHQTGFGWKQQFWWSQIPALDKSISCQHGKEHGDIIGLMKQVNKPLMLLFFCTERKFWSPNESPETSRKNCCSQQGLFFLLTLINLNYKMDKWLHPLYSVIEITYQFPNFNGYTPKVW